MKSHKRSNISQDDELLKTITEGDEKSAVELLENLIRGDYPRENFAKIRDSDGNSLLHLAIRRSQLETMSLILKEGLIDPLIRNDEGQNPLHYFHCENNFHKGTKTMKRSDLNEHRTLLSEFLSLAFNDKNKGDLINAQDQKGLTALHFAVEQKGQFCIHRLLNHGALLNIKSEVPKFQFVTPDIFLYDPWSYKIFEGQLNQGVTVYNTNECGEQEHEDFEHEHRFGISFDYSKIVPKSTVDKGEPQKEMEFVESLLSANKTIKKQIFNHPLISSFVFMKWKKVQRIFLFSFILHIILALLYTAYAMTVYLKNCPYHQFENTTQTQLDSNSDSECDRGLGHMGYSIILLIVTTILAILELAKFVQNIHRYVKTWRNYFQVVMIICMFLTIWPIRWMPGKCLKRWQYSASAYGIFHVWSTLMINMGRFPKLGIYVEMFMKVSRNFGYLMIAYIFLLIGFSISFCVLFPEYPPFQTIPRATLKVITMMSGELDYGDFFYKGEDKEGANSAMDFLLKSSHDGDLFHPITGHILYGTFVILVTMVLTNLLNGLAVEDIKELQQNTGFAKTIREVENIAYVESLIFWKRIPDCKFLRKLRRSIYIGKLPVQVNDETPVDNDDDKPPKNIIRRSLQLLSVIVFPSAPSTFNRKSSRRPSNRNKQKYTFRVSLDECKGPEDFPEEIYIKAVDLIKRQKQKKCSNSATTSQTDRSVRSSSRSDSSD